MRMFRPAGRVAKGEFLAKARFGPGRHTGGPSPILPHRQGEGKPLDAASLDERSAAPLGGNLVAGGRQVGMLRLTCWSDECSALEKTPCPIVADSWPPAW